MAPKSVLITGSSAGGIGGSMAEEFQRRGLHVFATARSISKLANLKDLPNVTLLQLDVTSRESIDAAVAAVKKETGGTLDILVNNSGIAYTVPALDANLRTVRDMFDVNFFGVVETTQAFAPLVIAAKGTIVNICSTAAHIDSPWFGLYAASKAAQEKFSESLRLEIRPFGVKVLSVEAGAVTTNMAASSAPFDLPEGSFYKATEKEQARQTAGEHTYQGMAPAVFAGKVVGDTLHGATGRVWRGNGATFVRLLAAFAPQFVMDKLFDIATAGRFEKA